MKKVIMLCLLIAFGLFTQGCSKDTPTETPPPAPTTVTFSIDNTDGFTASYYGPVRYVQLKRISDATIYHAHCVINDGVSANVSVTIPANDNYIVAVYSSDTEATYTYALWSSVAITKGSTYSIVIHYQGTSTLDGVARDMGANW